MKISILEDCISISEIKEGKKIKNNISFTTKLNEKETEFMHDPLSDSYNNLDSIDIDNQRFDELKTSLKRAFRLIEDILEERTHIFTVTYTNSKNRSNYDISQPPRCEYVKNIRATDCQQALRFADKEMLKRKYNLDDLWYSIGIKRIK